MEYRGQNSRAPLVLSDTLKFFHRALGTLPYFEKFRFTLHSPLSTHYLKRVIVTAAVYPTVIVWDTDLLV